MKKYVKVLAVLTLFITGCSKDDGNDLLLSDAKQITDFVFLASENEALDVDVIADINEETKTITALVPSGTAVTSLLPDVVVSEKATISPGSGIAQDFSNPVVYTVTAENGSTQDYNVEAKIITERDALLAIYNANPDNTLEWNLDDATMKTWQGVTLDTSGKVIELRLSLNNISTIPISIGALVNLTYLDISGNKIKELPVTMGNLIGLTELRVGDNVLINIPNEIVKLTKLRLLLLNENSLTSLPEEIGDLSLLEIFNVRGNQLISVPSTIGNLNKLRVLNLLSNKIVDLPEEMKQLSSLQTLYIQSNKLGKLPAFFESLSSLTELRADSNVINEIPEEIGNLTNLRTLSLVNNLFTTLPQKVCDLRDTGTSIATDAGVTCQ
ncbi:leucine-rich repeat domain-containing protein [Aquimarina sp. MMG016]|uniref:leucine-rich repeat domain-containing protein n=1 Tax=Aquimarina sp. MMG016 TaxID=2822690 RepID=UPI001B3A723D|nr:leucine-rich repeat domain-containing protein [Aquimarina sp. MMG016]MBQ4819859.1 DUF5018 domain-containing protein [Aquimarina sp. MMG016]